MASLFGSLTFKERGENAQFFPLFGRKAETTVTHIDGGSRNIIQSSGLQADRLSLNIRCTLSELQNLIGAIDTVKTLQWSGGSRSAYLEEVADPKEIFAKAKYFATLKLIGR